MSLHYSWTMSSVVNKIADMIKNKPFSYSFEVTPNVSLDEIDKLTINPVFFSITWHAKIHECQSLDIAPLQLAFELKSRGKNVLLHLSCDLMKKDYLDSLLTKLQEKGICNLFVILGESYDNSQSDFKSSKELIEYIKQRTGNYFCIGVAGFPAHSDEKLLHLKEKVDSGADFIITQAIFESESYKNFVNRCENMGVRVPVIPGIFLYKTHEELISFVKLCKVKVSEDVLNYENEDPEKSGTNMVRTLIENICNFGFSSINIHFFTLNKLERVSKFVNEINK